MTASLSLGHIGKERSGLLPIGEHLADRFHPGRIRVLPRVRRHHASLHEKTMDEERTHSTGERTREQTEGCRQLSHDVAFEQDLGPRLR